MVVSEAFVYNGKVTHTKVCSEALIIGSRLKSRKKVHTLAPYAFPFYMDDIPALFKISNHSMTQALLYRPHPVAQLVVIR